MIGLRQSCPLTCVFCPLISVLFSDMSADKVYSSLIAMQCHLPGAVNLVGVISYIHFSHSLSAHILKTVID